MQILNCNSSSFIYSKRLLNLSGTLLPCPPLNPLRDYQCPPDPQLHFLSESMQNAKCSSFVVNALTNSTKKEKDIDRFFAAILMMKNSCCNLTREEYRCYLSLMNNSMQKNYDINWFFQEILLHRYSHSSHTQPKLVISDGNFPWRLCPCKKNLIFRLIPLGYTDEEFCNLIGQETHTSTTKQKWWSQMLHSLDKSL